PLAIRRPLPLLGGTNCRPILCLECCNIVGGGTFLTLAHARGTSMPRNTGLGLGNSIRTKVRIPGPYSELLRESARRNMRSYSAEIALAIARYIEGSPAESAPRWERGALVATDMRLPADI